MRPDRRQQRIMVHARVARLRGVL